ncbi:hypothetical protein Desaci_1392 [Desulfosporosinus acidiphilus SJ4]|uniref:HTH cro/C1-type domain-containing protein n=1 Tax=Desulfosporosinus acidiphilus (strain DSM 22704 / JCM 16185 / SJ4) TaxID=646529 RepID=I4D3P1_DESAJ|nr:tetratricopeptide repeat protein [Desulfosporosinus acidiphilus]AFM40415.1 hypothetical protein Desaci_1392 [Desulfosporosinus acidiphilus SJ4]
MQKTIKATALKAYLKRNNILPSSLAMRCHISENYMSNILNAKRTNPRLPILVRMAAELDLPLHTVQELLRTSYDSLIPEKVLLESVAENHLLAYLQQILDASELNDFSMLSHLQKVISSDIPDSTHLKRYYLYWYDAYNLTSQNKFELAIQLFLEASKFVPKHEIEKRFKGKVLLGLGAAYTARGKYQQGLKAFRKSLFLWSDGYQAARVYMNLGTVYRRLTKYKLSVSAYEKAYEFGTVAIKLYSIVGLIQVALDNEDYKTARKWVIRGFRQAKTLESPRGKCDLYCNIAEYYSAIGKLNLSKGFYQRAIQVAIISGDFRTKQWAELELAKLFLRQGKEIEFETLMQTLELELSGTEDVLLVARHLNIMGKKYFEQSEYTLVISITRKAYILLKSLSPSISTELQESCRLLSEVYSALKEPKAAEFYRNEIKRHKLK